jgi:hypothetical protein
MKNPIFSNTKFLYTMLVLQLIPLLLFPPSVFELTSQKWWLPALLVIMALIGSIQLFRKTVAPWSLFIVSFAHGFNVISRLLMLLPQSTLENSFDGLYFSLSVVSMGFSAFMLWLLELPQARQVLVK